MAVPRGSGDPPHDSRPPETEGLQVRRDFASADQVGYILIFNVFGNCYRLIARVGYRAQRLYVKALLTHAEFDGGAGFSLRKDWLKWA